MKPKKLNKITRPNPPEDITGPALEEWNRIIEAIEALGRTLKPADVSILSVYCRTWAINQNVYEHVKKFGSVIRWPNGLPGASPQFKTYKETTVLLRGLLSDLGCTPQSRDFDVVTSAPADEQPKDLEY